MNHTVSLEVAKEMRENGWGKITQFYWSDWEDEDKLLNKVFYWGEDYSPSDATYDVYPAPTLTEILEELPAHIVVADCIKLKCWLSIKKIKDRYVIYYESIGYDPCDFYTKEDSNPCNAVAKLWMELRK